MGMIVRSPTTAETSPVRLSIVARIYSTMSEGVDRGILFNAYVGDREGRD
jgi:hypothetical protein